VPLEIVLVYKLRVLWTQVAIFFVLLHPKLFHAVVKLVYLSQLFELLSANLYLILQPIFLTN
jgi:hypothetical protein